MLNIILISSQFWVSIFTFHISIQVVRRINSKRRIQRICMHYAICLPFSIYCMSKSYTFYIVGEISQEFLDIQYYYSTFNLNISGKFNFHSGKAMKLQQTNIKMDFQSKCQSNQFSRFSRDLYYEKDYVRMGRRVSAM